MENASGHGEKGLGFLVSRGCQQPWKQGTGVTGERYRASAWGVHAFWKQTERGPNTVEVLTTLTAQFRGLRGKSDTVGTPS